ncbi:unnamed protein product [Rhizophagus irregularis]|nr:unnamed protein product [Rhizophagus irregularis]
MREGTIGLPSPTQQIAEFAHRINNPSLAQRIRLRSAQLKALITLPIFDIALSDVPNLRYLSVHNVNLHILLAARTMNISFQTGRFDRGHWSIKGGLTSLYQLFQ